MQLSLFILLSIYLIVSNIYVESPSQDKVFLIQAKALMLRKRKYRRMRYTLIFPQNIDKKGYFQ